MCYCIYGIFSSIYFLVQFSLVVVLIAFTFWNILQGKSRDDGEGNQLPLGLTILNFAWIIIQ